ACDKNRCNFEPYEERANTRCTAGISLSTSLLRMSNSGDDLRAEAASMAWRRSFNKRAEAFLCSQIFATTIPRQRTIRNVASARTVGIKPPSRPDTIRTLRGADARRQR